jgi:ketosteroid isomerase-like protein
MDNYNSSRDEQAVKELDRSWNDVYVRNDRSAFAEIPSDDFCTVLLDGRRASKADLMRTIPQGAQVDFSEASLEMFAPTAVSRGRIRIQHPDRVVDQRLVRVYSKRETG